MGAIGHAFSSVVHGVEDVGKGLAKGVEGAENVVGGALTLNPKEISNGVGEISNGVQKGIGGIAGAAAGVEKGVIDSTPLGAAVNDLTGGALNRIIDGLKNVGTGIVDQGVGGLGQVGQGVLSGNLKEALSGALNVGQVALLAVPGAGEGELADLALNVGMGVAGQLAAGGAGGGGTAGV